MTTHPAAPRGLWRWPRAGLQVATWRSPVPDPACCKASSARPRKQPALPRRPGQRPQSAHPVPTQIGALAYPRSSWPLLHAVGLLLPGGGGCPRGLGRAAWEPLRGLHHLRAQAAVELFLDGSPALSASHPVAPPTGGALWDQARGVVPSPSSTQGLNPRPLCEMPGAPYPARSSPPPATPSPV